MSQDCRYFANTTRWAAGIAMLISSLLWLPEAQASDPWTLIVVPDTQHYVDKSANVHHFDTKMTWIANNIEARNIAFVTHLGDVVQHGDRVLQWDRAENAINIIHGLVPYSVSIGDHDYVIEEERASGAPEFLARFGAARYAGFPWYGGASPDEKSHYQIFSAGGRQFLHLNLEWEIPGEPSDPTRAMGWAKHIMATYPNLPTIISTHSYVWDKDLERGRTNGVEENSGDGSSGEMIWSELVRNSPQVFMVLNGNFHRGTSQYDASDPTADPSAPSTDGEHYQVTQNLHGQPVYEMLSNFQDYPNGGDGWMRIITFETGTGAGGLDRIRVQTYSPSYDAYQTDPASHFHFDLSFAERFDDILAPLPLERVTFTAGETVHVRDKYPTRNYSGNDVIRVGVSDEHGGYQGLIRFDGSFDTGALQGAHIVSAQLRIGISSSGPGVRLYRMLQPWSASTATWDTLNGGVSPNGVQAASAPDLITTAHISRSESPCHGIYDVTDAVRAWQAGQANHGWAVLSQSSSDRMAFRSFDNSIFRPELVIDYLPPKELRVTSGQDAYVWRKEPDSNFGASNRILVDWSDGMVQPGQPQPMQGLIRFNIPFGSDAGQVPHTATIVRAFMRIRVTTEGHGFRMHRMLVPWNEHSVTWNSLGHGINDDGVDAVEEPDAITEDFLEKSTPPQYVDIEVTEGVRAWQAGQPNHGWALLPLGDNKLFIESFQGSKLRPELVIHYGAP